jgi:outer membrane lipoprotein-sorting protein
MQKNIIKVLVLSAITFSQAQAITADEIVNSYYENTGGAEVWNKLNGIKMTGEMNQGGMKFPFEIISLKDGKQYMEFNFQGKELKQGVFNGEVMWNTNFMTMKAEKADAETTANQKLEMNDFPFPLFNYKEKGYKLELLGTEEKEGAEVYKLKLIREPKTVDGKQVEDISFYYFDVDSFVPLSTETEMTSGPMKGKIGESKLSDYQEVDGLYFPFSMTQGVKDGPGVTMMVSKIELNPEVSASEFDMPVVTAEKKDATEESK